MYRFSFAALAFAIAAAAYFLAPATQEIPKADHQALMLTNSDAAQRVKTMPAIPDGMWRAVIEAEYKAIEAADTVSSLASGVSDNEGADQAVALAVQADSEKIADAHVPSSATTGEIDPALTKLSLFDLKSATQRELTRLGCYGAEIDGLWGSKSRAAVAKFNEQTGGDWDDMPSPQLASALRSAPDNLCEQSCSPGASGPPCNVASAIGGTEKANDSENKLPSYLPPWMRGETIANAEQRVIETETRASASAEEHTLRIVEQRVERQREADRWYADRSYRKRKSDWAPPGWPGTR